MLQHKVRPCCAKISPPHNRSVNPRTVLLQRPRRHIHMWPRLLTRTWLRLLTQTWPRLRMVARRLSIRNLKIVGSRMQWPREAPRCPNPLSVEQVLA